MSKTSSFGQTPYQICALELLPSTSLNSFREILFPNLINETQDSPGGVYFLRTFELGTAICKTKPSAIVRGGIGGGLLIVGMDVMPTGEAPCPYNSIIDWK